MLFYFVVECAYNQCVQVNIVFKNHVWDQELFTGKELHLKRHTKKKLGSLRCQPINLEILKSNSAVRGEMYMPLKTIHWARQTVGMSHVESACMDELRPIDDHRRSRNEPCMKCRSCGCSLRFFVRHSCKPGTVSRIQIRSIYASLHPPSPPRRSWRSSLMDRAFYGIGRTKAYDKASKSTRHHLSVQM